MATAEDGPGGDGSGRTTAGFDVGLGVGLGFGAGSGVAVARGFGVRGLTASTFVLRAEAGGAA